MLWVPLQGAMRLQGLVPALQLPLWATACPRHQLKLHGSCWGDIKHGYCWKPCAHLSIH